MYSRCLPNSTLQFCLLPVPSFLLGHEGCGQARAACPACAQLFSVLFLLFSLVAPFPFPRNAILEPATTELPTERPQRGLCSPLSLCSAPTGHCASWCLWLYF